MRSHHQRTEHLSPHCADRLRGNRWSRAIGLGLTWKTPCSGVFVPCGAVSELSHELLNKQRCQEMDWPGEKNWEGSVGLFLWQHVRHFNSSLARVLSYPTSHTGNSHFQHKTYCIKGNLWVFCALMKMMNGCVPSQEGNSAFVGSQSYSTLPMSCEGEYLSPEPAHPTQAAPPPVLGAVMFCLYTQCCSAFLNQNRQIHAHPIHISSSYLPPFFLADVHELQFLDLPRLGNCRK